jgi:ABC-type transporter Mla MlaB component
VALPFFKKGKDKPADAGAKAAATSSAAAEAAFDEPLGLDTGSGIVVEETSGAPQSPIDEAAILYASGHAEGAEQMLKASVAAGDRRAWHMLFDLYAIQNREKELEQLSLAYAMRFETSPPVRQHMAEKTGGKAKGQTASLELPGLLDKNATAALKKDIAATAKNDVVRIDFSRIEMVDEPGALECLHILAAARKARRKLRVSGVDRLIALLQDLIRATRSRAVHWLLLLELYQTLGQQENFENLAVDYAVHFEMSPPSWSEVEAAEVVQAAPAEADDDALRLSGEIVPGNDVALQQFSSHAATHEAVLVDLSQVTRIDYASVGQFISVLMQGLGTGKTVTLRGQNALIHELFRVMGIDQLAQLIPHHPD